MITVEVIQMVVKANHDISSGLDTAFINSAINSNLAYDKEAKEFYFLGEIFAKGFPTPIKWKKQRTMHLRSIILWMFRFEMTFMNI